MGRRGMSNITRHFTTRTTMAVIIAISVIVMVTLVYMLWDSLDYLKQVNKTLGSIVVICGVAVWVISERTETLQSALDAKEARKAIPRSQLLTPGKRQA